MEVTEHLTDWEFWEIRSLYPMVGLTSLIVTPGYLACWLLERPNVKSGEIIKEKEDCKKVDIGCRRQVALKTLPKALRTQALTALTSNFGLVGLVW